jgi:hypothetical protein
LNRKGVLHTCLIDSGTIDINSLGRSETDDKIVYGERVNDYKWLKDIISIYTFQKQGDKTLVSAEIDFKVKSLIGRLIKPLLRKVLLNQTIKGFAKLKTSSEKEYGG